MKAIIFNSGLGSRLEELTHNKPKCLVKLYNNETILERQIRILSFFNITDFVITTGPFKDQVENIKNTFPNLNFTFVHNDKYNETNYIYSLYLAQQYIRNEEVLMLHGDLVFNYNLIKEVLNYKSSLPIATFFKKAKLPEKDFKCLIKNNTIKKISVEDMGKEGVFKFQALYRFDSHNLNSFLDEVTNFIENKNLKTCYAENALNELLENNMIQLHPFDVRKNFIEEIDNKKDLKKVNETIKYIDYNEQLNSNKFEDLISYIKQNKANKKIFVVHSNSFLRTKLYKNLIKVIGKENLVFFSKFSPNPKYEEALLGLDEYKKSNSSIIFGIGGGSAIDTAKAIKYYSENTSTKLIACPTTAGTGSEATKFAVIYKDGVKTSLDEEYLLPNFVYFDYSMLKTVPFNVKISTLLDSFCQSVESIFSKKGNLHSLNNALKSISLINKNLSNYVDNNKSLKQIQQASYYSGKAINISYTTAPHGLSYKITSLFNINHGQAVAMAFIPTFKLLNAEKFIKEKNKKYVNKVLNSLTKKLKCNNLNDFEEIKNNIILLVSRLLNKIKINVIPTTEQLNELVNTVNSQRLSNFIIELSEIDIYNIYCQAFK